MTDEETLRQRIEAGERLFPASYAPLLEELSQDLRFVIEDADDRPSLNKRGRLPEPQKCVQIKFRPGI